jgi:hypothetical protein
MGISGTSCRGITSSVDLRERESEQTIPAEEEEEKHSQVVHLHDMDLSASVNESSLRIGLFLQPALVRKIPW